ncbi:MAG: short-chain dehydrogenase, partial [Candidatus Nephrothrix sp. EaCA]
MVNEAVKKFRSLDVFVSNAGVLKAGGLEELKKEDFEFLTK